MTKSSDSNIKFVDAALQMIAANRLHRLHPQIPFDERKKALTHKCWIDTETKLSAHRVPSLQERREAFAKARREATEKSHKRVADARRDAYDKAHKRAFAKARSPLTNREQNRDITDEDNGEECPIGEENGEECPIGFKYEEDPPPKWVKQRFETFRRPEQCPTMKEYMRCKKLCALPATSTSEVCRASFDPSLLAHGGDGGDSDKSGNALVQGVYFQLLQHEKLKSVRYPALMSLLDLREDQPFV
jgi:hypothetical protein